MDRDTLWAIFSQTRLVTLFPGSDVCVGRNGATLFERTGNVMYLKGMASFGPVPCHDEKTKGIPGVFASIDYYLPWIRSQLKP
jgi:secreted trypsin-like serine protease